MSLRKRARSLRRADSASELPLLSEVMNSQHTKGGGPSDEGKPTSASLLIFLAPLQPCTSHVLSSNPCECLCGNCGNLVQRQRWTDDFTGATPKEVVTAAVRAAERVHQAQARAAKRRATGDNQRTRRHKKCAALSCPVLL